MRLILPLFILLPIVEMVILIQVGGVLGALPTIGLVLLTAMIGLHLLRQQGLATLMRANERLATGEMPAEEVIEGLMLAVGGALLLTPGFVTDTIGFCCLIPKTRTAIARHVMAKGILKATSHKSFQHSGFEFYNQQAGHHFGHSSSSSAQGDIIDGESSAVNDDQLLK